MLIYLAGPIDQVSDEDGAEWRMMATEALAQMGVASFDPRAAYGRGRADLRRVMEINFAAVRASTGILAYYLPDLPTVGTWLELGYARAVGKRVVIWGPGGHVPLIVFELFPLYSDLDRAIKDLLGDT